MSRLLHRPLAVTVSDGRPVSVDRGNGRGQVVRWCNHWRAQVDWWREAVEMDYWRLMLDDGLVCELSHDLTGDTWRLERIYD
ncbi:MAG: hypothetical protein ACYDAY_07245 [Candidatus Dormibacteria bacterium]